jgi:peptide subunit release factor RF-3
MPVDHSKKYKNVITKPFEICIIQAIPFILLVKKWDYKIFTVIIEDIKKALKLKQYINSQPLVPKEYHNIINKFEKWFTDQLPPYWDKYDFKIKLEPSMILKFGLLYSIS